MDADVPGRGPTDDVTDAGEQTGDYAPGISSVEADDATVVWALMNEFVFGRGNFRQRVTEELDISFARVRALRRLLHAPLRLRDLAAKLGTDAPYTTLMVDDLEKRGLVERAADPSDRRAKLVTLTPAGRTMAERANSIMAEPPAELRAAPPDALARLRELLLSIS